MSAIKRFIQRMIPDQQTLMQSRALRPLAGTLARPQLWRVSNYSVSLGAAIGVFFSMWPIVGHMLLAAGAAVVVRAHLPTAVAATWVNNPLTMPLVFAGNYWVGAQLLQQPAMSVSHLHWTVTELMNVGEHIIYPLLIGSAVVSIVAGTAAFVIVQLVWRFGRLFSIIKKQG